MNRFKQAFMRFMQGRYGMDGLGNFLFVVSLICMFIAIIIRPLGFFYYIGFAILIYGYYRMMSRNVAKRYQENVKFSGFVGDIRQKFSVRKTHRIFKCPNCAQKIRVPKGKGRICIKCPKCRIEFIKKT